MRLLLAHIKTESFGPFNILTIVYSYTFLAFRREKVILMAPVYADKIAALVMVAAYVAHFLMYGYVYLKHMKFAFGRPG